MSLWWCSFGFSYFRSKVTNVGLLLAAEYVYSNCAYQNWTNNHRVNSRVYWACCEVDWSQNPIKHLTFISVCSDCWTMWWFGSLGVSASLEPMCHNFHSLVIPPSAMHITLVNNCRSLWVSLGGRFTVYILGCTSGLFLWGTWSLFYSRISGSVN